LQRGCSPVPVGCRTIHALLIEPAEPHLLGGALFEKGILTRLRRAVAVGERTVIIFDDPLTPPDGIASSGPPLWKKCGHV
jgi:hypothetical protein